MVEMKSVQKSKNREVIAGILSHHLVYFDLKASYFNSPVSDFMPIELQRKSKNHTTSHINIGCGLCFDRFIYLSAKETHIFEMPDNHSRRINIIVRKKTNTEWLLPVNWQQRFYVKIAAAS